MVCKYKDLKKCSYMNGYNFVMVEDSSTYHFHPFFQKQYIDCKIEQGYLNKEQAHMCLVQYYKGLTEAIRILKNSEKHSVHKLIHNPHNFPRVPLRRQKKNEKG